MKARLTTGEVVTLGKGCDCITHNIPHWVHEFRQSRDMSRKEFDGYVHRMRAIESSAAGGKAAEPISNCPAPATGTGSSHINSRGPASDRRKARMAFPS